MNVDEIMVLFFFVSFFALCFSFFDRTKKGVSSEPSDKQITVNPFSS
jgi:hypothetical protein